MQILYRHIRGYVSVLQDWKGQKWANEFTLFEIQQKPWVSHVTYSTALELG